MKNRIAVYAVCMVLIITFCSCAKADLPDPFSDNEFVYNYISKTTLSISCNYLNTAEEITLPHTLPDKEEIVTMVASKGFKKLETMSSLIISEGYTTIENEAFAECSNLVSAVLPSTLVRIRTAAFKNCLSLSELYVYAQTPPVLIGDIFTIPAQTGEEEEETVIFDFTIYIPSGSLGLYVEADVWKNYSDFFVEVLPKR